MVLYVIGLGLGNEKDITIRGLEAIKKSSLVFLEHYTSVLGVNVEKLEEFYGCKIQLAYRDDVETNAASIYEPAKDNSVSFLVVGDPFCATTHSDLILRARKEDIAVEVIHNASVMGAVGACGLQLYNYGQTVSIPFFREDWKPDSFYDKIAFNMKGNLHTLCLLDIKVKEPDYQAAIKGKYNRFLPPSFMTVNQAISQLLEIESYRKENVINEDTMIVGMARLGQETQQIVAGKMKDLLHVNFGEPLHCLVIASSNMHCLEYEMLQHFIQKF